jgi:serine/threonine protein kinase/tetratricopeptide (TPR) repeat protein
MNATTSSARDIFVAALKLPPDQWEAYLIEACGGDEALLERVRTLLAAHRDAGSFLDPADVGPVGTTIEDLTERPGTAIGPYKLLQKIGEGGMGVVFMAEQTHEIQRKVALKVIKPGLDSTQVVARFEAERQALAVMDHVNIARVLDGGRTSSGRPYFVMELVNGVPITKYCDDNHLTPRERLELFIPVCQAIQHAHQKGIIHRDIKPSNVMVTLYDGKPVPKVIDFGVAKAVEQKLTERTLFTNFGTMVGTLEYMSPEQAEMSALGIDTRSDIYSLGVLLYQLLTGSTPLSRQRLKDAAYAEVMRIIKEEEPQKPSTRLSDSGEALASISAQRKMEPAKLTKLVRGELDWIVMKTLEKDRNRRYETANGLAMDVQRYLANETVQACPPSAGYRLRKFVRRNKGPVVAGFALAALLVLGIVCTSIGLVWALRAERTAGSERDQAKKAKKLADEEAAISKAVNDFLLDDLLAEASPEQNARYKKLAVEELLDRAASRIEGKFAQQPRTEAAIRHTIGGAYFDLGVYLAAQRHLERAVELRRQLLGEEHKDTLDSMSNLAGVLREQGELSKAESLYLRVLEHDRRVHGEEHTDTLCAMNNLATVYSSKGENGKAEPLLSKALRVSNEKLGDEDSLSLSLAGNLAKVYQELGQYDKAERYSVMTLEITRRKLSEEHPDTLIAMNNLGALYKDQRRFTEAEPLFIRALEIRRRVLDEEHPLTLSSLNNLASLYNDMRQYEMAEPLFVKVLEPMKRIMGVDHRYTLTTMDSLAILYVETGQFAKAEPLRRELLETSQRRDGDASPSATRARANLGLVLLKQHKFGEAEPILRKCLALREKKEPDIWTTFNTKSMLGGSLLGQKKYAEAESLLLSGYEGMKARENAISLRAQPRMADAIERLIQLYEVTGKKDQADQWRKKLPATNPDIPEVKKKD